MGRHDVGKWSRKRRVFGVDVWRPTAILPRAVLQGTACCPTRWWAPEFWHVHLFTLRPRDVRRLKLPDTLDLDRAARRVTRFAALHHKSIAAAVSVGLAGFAVTAFGIAPMAPAHAR